MWENIWQFFPTTKQANPSISWVTQILRVRGIPLKKWYFVVRNLKNAVLFFFIAQSAFPLKPKTKKQCKTRFYIALISFIYQKNIWIETNHDFFAHSFLIFQWLERSIRRINYLTWGYLEDGIPGLGSAVKNHGLHPFFLEYGSHWMNVDVPLKKENALGFFSAVAPWWEVTMQQWKRVVASGIWPCSF